MTEFPGPGTFWLASTPERRSVGVLVVDEERWRLEVESRLFDSVNQPTTRKVGGRVMQTFNPSPVSDVLDMAPRVVHGRLETGSPVTLFDAQEAGSEWVWPRGPQRQRFEGWRVLIGELVSNLDAAARGVRWTIGSRISTSAMARQRVRGGTLSSYVHADRAGLCLIVDKPRSVKVLADLTSSRISALLAIASGGRLEPLHREILLPSGSWCVYGADRQPPSESDESDFVDRRLIDLSRVAAWADLSTELGPLPFIAANVSSTPLQFQAQTLAVALEGLHRRLHTEQKPFEGIARRGVRRAVEAAVEAGADQLRIEGWKDPKAARIRFMQALNHVGQMTYAERLRGLLKPVEQVAPGLFGPDLDDWITKMTAVRNVQSHQLADHDDFGEQEISLYFVLAQTARWALRIALLLPILPGLELRKGLRRSSRFAYTLANIDTERVWPGFSCGHAFSTARTLGG